MTARLRPLGDGDLDRIAELEPVLFGAGAWSRETYAEEVHHPDRRYVVVEVGGVLAGYAGIALGPDCEVMTIGVAPEFRRRGLGAQLLTHLVDEARAASAAHVFLEVRTADAVAQHLYTSFGFVPLGIRRGYYQPEGADALVMRLRLEPPASKRIGPIGSEAIEE